MVLHENFHETIAKKHKVNDCYKKLCFSNNNTNIYNSKNNNLTANNGVLNVSLFPSFIKPVFYNNTEVFKIPQEKITGYAVLIKNHTDLDTLFKTAYKKSFRANILRYVNRFESCFNANYKLFYGEITKEEYTFLMNTLHRMLTTRFDQRNDSNKVINNWSTYIDTTYYMIKEKKASLFVIYNNTTPVQICINHHFNNILFVSVPSYDIDYARFALGNISIYKLLEWSIANNYKMLDMGYGDLEYKRRWSTLIYHFEHHIFYKNIWSQTLMAKIEKTKIQFKNYLKSKNIDETLKNLKNKIFKSKNNFKEATFTVEPISLSESNYKQVAFQIDNRVNNVLKKPVFDYLYKYKEHIDHIKVFEIQPSRIYIISGNNIAEKITLT
jgi:hypothetical protein